MENSIRTNVLVGLAVAAILVLSPALVALLPWKGKASGRTASVLLIISVAVLVLVALLADVAFGISASWAFTLIIWAMGCGVCLAVWLRYRSILSLAVAVLLTAFVAVLHFMDILPVKPYKRFFAAIQIGMTEDEVSALLRREFPKGGRFPVPVRRDFGRDEIDFFLSPNEGAWNAEGIFIHLNEGRVVSKQYSRD